MAPVDLMKHSEKSQHAVYAVVQTIDHRDCIHYKTESVRKKSLWKDGEKKRPYRRMDASTQRSLR